MDVLRQVQEENFLLEPGVKFIIDDVLHNGYLGWLLAKFLFVLYKQITQQEPAFPRVNFFVLYALLFFKNNTYAVQAVIKKFEIIVHPPILHNSSYSHQRLFILGFLLFFFVCFVLLQYKFRACLPVYSVVF